MNRVSLVVLLLALASSALAAQQQGWIVVPGVTIAESQGLISSYDVRSILPDMALLVGDSLSLASLRRSFPAAFLAAKYDPSASYLLIERPEFENKNALVESDWSFESLSAIDKAGLTVLFSSTMRFLVSAPGFSRSTYEGFPAETEFVTMPAQRIVPVPAEVKQALRDARFGERRDDISDLISQVNVDSLTGFDLHLTGEGAGSNFTTRNSFSTEVYTAANWIQSHFQASGFSVSQLSFQSTYGPNVIATLRGTDYPDTYVIVGAHYDSRAASSSSPTQRAPGGNDDGSGTSMLLEIARLISLNRLSFKYSVILGAWCGEEQGLVGSRAYARDSRARGMDIKAMLQGDMLAYRVPGERLQVGFPDRYHTPELTAQVKTIVNTYVPDIDACDTSSCCSDQQSFYEQGYPATFFFERCAPLADNQYHREGDLVNRLGFDKEQWTLITQSIFASLLTLAELN